MGEDDKINPTNQAQPVQVQAQAGAISYPKKCEKIQCVTKGIYITDEEGYVISDSTGDDYDKGILYMDADGDGKKEFVKGPDFRGAFVDTYKSAMKKGDEPIDPVYLMTGKEYRCLTKGMAGRHISFNESVFYLNSESDLPGSLCFNPTGLFRNAQIMANMDVVEKCFGEDDPRVELFEEYIEGQSPEEESWWMPAAGIVLAVALPFILFVWPSHRLGNYIHGKWIKFLDKFRKGGDDDKTPPTGGGGRSVVPAPAASPAPAVSSPIPTTSSPIPSVSAQPGLADKAGKALFEAGKAVYSALDWVGNGLENAGRHSVEYLELDAASETALLANRNLAMGIGVLGIAAIIGYSLVNAPYTLGMMLVGPAAQEKLQDDTSYGGFGPMA